MCNYRTLTLLLLLLTVTLACVAQSASDSASFNRSTQIKLNTLGFFDPGTPSLQIGLERRLNRKWAVEVTAGLPCYIAYPGKNRDSLYNKNLKFKLQVKRYNTSNNNNYIALELFNTIAKYNAFNGRFRNDTGEYGYPKADITKNIYGLAFKAGTQIKLSHQWSIDIADACGIRLINTKIKAPVYYPYTGEA